ncbi:ribosomal biogenesis protein LAS1L-like protein isoform X2, partial [Tanacetum coccineum]
KHTPYLNTLKNSRPLPDFEEYAVSTSADTPYMILWSTIKKNTFSANTLLLLGESRGCLPILTEATASIVEIQQMDSHFREGLSESDLLANDMLTPMMNCMTLMRLVNSIMEKTRKKNEISIGEWLCCWYLVWLINIVHGCFIITGVGNQELQLSNGSLLRIHVEEDLSISTVY